MKLRACRTAQVVVRFITLLFGLVFCHCSLLEDKPPFHYLAVQIVKGDELECHHLIGIHYSLRNASDRAIVAFHASFSLFDVDGNQVPGPGDNCFDVAFSGSIEPETTWSVCSSLDSSFYFLPEPELVAERFRIYQVDFDDGSRWEDPFALYGYPYPVTSGQSPKADVQ